jgi:HAE1 family hydrophobic/amphiphilic exporter-1
MLGIFGIMAIPKESTPNIPYGIISIGVAYPGTNPIDMDALVTEKIEKEIKDISGIKKMSSTSSLGFASIILELETSAKTSDVLNEVRNAVSRVVLPPDAKSPIISEIKSDTERVFSVLLYGKLESITDDKIRDRAQTIKETLETVPEIASVDIEGTNVYDMRVIFDAARLEAMKLSLTDIASALRSYHRDVPLGNYSINEKDYDFRIE